MKVRVLYGWDGLGRPFPPGTIVELDEIEACGRVQAGHVEAVEDAEPVTPPPPPADEDPPAGDTGDAEGSEDGGGGADDIDARAAELSKLKRDGLNETAAAAGVADPEGYRTKADLIVAILEEDGR